MNNLLLCRIWLSKYSVENMKFCDNITILYFVDHENLVNCFILKPADNCNDSLSIDSMIEYLKPHELDARNYWHDKRFIKPLTAIKCWIRLGASLKLVQYSQNNSTPYSVLSAPMIQIIISTRKFIQPWYNKVGQYLTTYQHYLSTYFLLTIDGTALYSYCIRAAAGAPLQHVLLYTGSCWCSTAACVTVFGQLLVLHCSMCSLLVCYGTIDKLNPVLGDQDRILY